VIQSDGDQGEKPGVIALSASCTHMGCLVHWQRSDRKYHCPCHGGLFSEYGKPDKAASIPYLAALPRLETRMTTRGNERFIEVKVPANPRTNGS
jgi:Rieske Fe-S protein